MAKNILNVVSKKVSKFVAIVPATDRLLPAPEGAAIAEYSPVQTGGLAAIWVHNATDVGTAEKPTPNGTWQGLLPGCYFLGNEVVAAIGRKAKGMLPEGYGIEDLDNVVQYLITEGFVDQYGTDDGTVNGNQKKDRAPRFLPMDVVFGTEKAFKADRLKIVYGIVLPSGEKVNTVTRKGDKLYIDHADGAEPKRIEQDILLRTYSLDNGQEINLDDLVEA